MTQHNGNDQQESKGGQPKDDDKLEIRRHPVNQGGHQGMGGHGGQQSGGMGGMHGGDLHDIGSAQSGMTGGAGMGGNAPHHRQEGGGAQQRGDAGNEQRAEAGGHEIAEVQQSAQREGMGQHRHSSRANEQAIDATDADDLGSRDSAAAESGPDLDDDQDFTRKR